MKRLQVAAVVALALGAYLLFVFPLRGLISEMNQVHAAQRSLSELNRTNQNLKHEVALYSSPSYIAKIARTSYGMVGAGQTPYMIMPGSPLYVAPVSRSAQSPS